LRALENLVHEGSHCNWIRTNPKLNDRLTNYFAAFWVLLRVQAIRAIHQNHHSDFSGAGDPCLPRFTMLGLAASRRKSFKCFLVELCRHYPGHVREYWTGYGRVGVREILRAATLHGTVMVGGSLLIPGFWMGWLVGVLLPFCLLLPFFRMFAESEEHSYDGSPEALDTFDNGGWVSRFFLHPAGDARHWLHHVLASIPHHKMERAHRLFLQYDPFYRNLQKRR
jgi:fatty acid desaturase